MVESPTELRAARYEPIACTVWYADLEVTPMPVIALTSAEEQRRNRLARQADKDRFTAGVTLVRHLVGRETGLVPESVLINRRCARCRQQHGKPEIMGCDVHISISHSERIVAVALTRAAPIGIDVEWIADRDTTDLAQVVLSHDEPASDTDDFYRYWCRKEAAMKATGEGLQAPANEVVVSPPAAAPAVRSYRGQPLPCAMTDLDLAVGYAATVAVLAPGQLDTVVHRIDFNNLPLPEVHSSAKTA